MNGTWEQESVYTQENLTAADEEWLKLNIDYAFVSLTKEDSDAMGLPRSMSFPWDAQKSLYLLSSVHSVHCLVRLPISCLTATDWSSKCYIGRIWNIAQTTHRPIQRSISSIVLTIFAPI